MKKYIIFVVFALKILTGKTEDNNVCSTYNDYAHKENNDNCWYDPDVNGVIEDIIRRHGYKVESYNVTTSDGYILKLFRIPSATNDTSNQSDKTPLLFYHGINRDARCFLLRGELSPAFQYVNKGYDVWLANSRGTEYSSHVSLSTDDKKFWDFSFHEIGTIDVPSILEKIAEETNKAGEIIYVGHSMGTSIGFVYASVNTTHCKKFLKALIALAPIAKLNKVKIPLARLASLNWKLLQAQLKLADINHIKTSIFWPICNFYPVNKICGFLIQFVSGFSSVNLYPQMLPIFSSHGDAPLSVKTLVHYAQIIKSRGSFDYYDYGPAKNIHKYSSVIPPNYKINEIPIDVDLIFANNDYIAVEEDCNNLFAKLPEGKKTITQVPIMNKTLKLAHEDFLLATTDVLFNEIYPSIDTALEKYK